MGRALPELQMISQLIHRPPCYPAALCDDKGNHVLVPHIKDVFWLERLMRASVVEFGGAAGLALPPLNGKEARECMIPFSLSRAWKIGR
jgi:DUF917 family protein